ncbi:MAG TPA: hypothetical protein VGI85_00900 [Chthoniobacterales bacterium]|jgi:hypothetical protein
MLVSRKRKGSLSRDIIVAVNLITAGVIFPPPLSRAGEGKGRPAVGITGVIVQGMFGGRIFGFDIDATGTDGVLSELQNGGVTAVETFDQNTGKILKVVARMPVGQGSDFITLGVTGTSAGLIERELVRGSFRPNRRFGTINPLDRGRINGRWTPPLDSHHLVSVISRNQGTPNNAVLTLDISANGFMPTIFSSNIAANTFGPVITLTDDEFTNGCPALAYDPVNNRAILGVATLGNPFVPGKIATVDLASGLFTKFTGVGDGDVNGIAYDPVSGTACTTTEIDYSVEFYNIATQSGFAERLPGAVNQFFSGADVEFDPINRLFLVAQPHSSTSSGGSSIHVYDISGNLIESLNGFSFSNASNVVPVHIALNPAARLGFVDGPDAGVTQIESFTY